jgi:hypothetical protein
VGGLTEEFPKALPAMAQKPEALEFDEDIRSAHRRSHSWDELKTRDLFQKRFSISLSAANSLRAALSSIEI